MTQLRSSNSRSGVVLLMVLWTLILLTILVSSYVQSSSTEGLQARHLLNTTRARYAAEAGLHRAVFELGQPVLELRWKGDGRPYDIVVDGAKVTIEMIDESGKIDLNQSDARILTSLFRELLGEQKLAEAMAARVMDWRDPDDSPLPNGAEKAEYAAEGLNYGPRNQLFATVGELQQVLGMSYELFLQIEPMLSITSGTSQPNLAYAQADVLGVVLRADGAPVSQEQIDAVIQVRQTTPSGVPIPLPNGATILAGGAGSTYTIRSRAEFEGGANGYLEATVQLGSGTVGLRPFRVARWREGRSN